MSELVALLALTGGANSEALTWEKRLTPILRGPKKGRVAALEQLAKSLGVPSKTVAKKFYALKKNGLAGLIDRRAGGKRLWNTRTNRGLSEEDQQIVKTWCENYQRSSSTAIDDLRTAWKRGEVITSTPVDPRSGYPFNWSKRTLHRHKPSDYELTAARQGRSAAAAHRPLVYTTRQGLYVGQFFLFDDLWHDHEVNLLDTQQSGRPLEFHGLDLASAYKMCWGIKMRREVDGKNQTLNEREFRFLLAGHLFTTGYHPRGTTLILENQTTNVTDLIERLLADGTRTAECPDGAIRVERGGMTGAAAHAGQYAGRPKGNFRFKAALESLGNLIHNKMSYLPAQVGKDRQHSPEQLHGLNKYNDALLIALSQLPPERAQWLMWPKCTLQQFQLVAADIYAGINGRKEHKLEGWDDNYVPCNQTGKMRRMSPEEVWKPRRRVLQPISDELCALIIGPEGGKERSIQRGMFELTSAELSGDIQRFDATMLPPRGKFLTVINPFQPDSLWCFDAKGRPVARCPRIYKPCRGDEVAVRRQIARASEQESRLLAPMQARHAHQARQRVELKKNNARVLSGRPITVDEHAALDALHSRLRKEHGSLEDLTDQADLGDRSAEPVVTDRPGTEPDSDGGDDFSLAALCSSETTEPDNDQDYTIG